MVVKPSVLILLPADEPCVDRFFIADPVADPLGCAVGNERSPLLWGSGQPRHETLELSPTETHENSFTSPNILH